MPSGVSSNVTDSVAADEYPIRYSGLSSCGPLKGHYVETRYLFSGPSTGTASLTQDLGAWPLGTERATLTGPC